MHDFVTFFIIFQDLPGGHTPEAIFTQNGLKDDRFCDLHYEHVYSMYNKNLELADSQGIF